VPIFSLKWYSEQVIFELKNINRILFYEISNCVLINMSHFTNLTTTVNEFEGNASKDISENDEDHFEDGEGDSEGDFW
jgi:hypothetical protein